MQNNTRPFLPSSMEIESMTKNEFEAWIWKTEKELPKIIEKRDPLFWVQKRISKILENTELSEVRKENLVLHEIERYKRIISQPR